MPNQSLQDQRHSASEEDAHAICHTCIRSTIHIVEIVDRNDQIRGRSRASWTRPVAASLCISAHTCSAVRVGSRSRNHVATPLTTGDAMEVPLIFRFFHLGKLSVMAHCLGLDRLRYGCNKINEHDLDTLGQFW